ncbi:kinase-like domain-containing protein, partial [Rhizophagus diaphanus]
MSTSSQIHWGQCDKCGEHYGVDLNAESEWCKPCQANYLKEYFANWTSGNENIDGLIQEMRSKIDGPSDIVFEWIPYNQFDNIREDVKGNSSKVYSAIWKDGPLSYSYFKRKLTRVSGKKVALKCVFNLQYNIDEFLNEVKTYSVDCSNNILKIYGISQNPVTEEYIMVLHNEYFKKYCKICCSTRIEHKWCNSCHINLIRKNFINGNSGNKEVDDYIQEMQLSISNPCTIVFEWIPYDRFDNINTIGEDNTCVVNSAIWKDGPLHYEYTTGWSREPNKKVALKYSQNATNEFFLNEVKTYSINYYDDNIIYGISQNPRTKVYFMVIQDKYHEKCVKCEQTYIDMRYEWYNPCYHMQYERYSPYHHFENEKLNDLIQEMRASNVNFGWIPYDQFNDIMEIGKGCFATTYSAIWKDRPLYYLYDKKEWIRKSNKKFALKCLRNSQNSIGEFLNKVKAYLEINTVNTSSVINIYGISQNPNTKEYIMVLDYAEGGNFYNYLNKNWENFDWFNGLKILTNIIDGLDKIHQKQMIHRDFHTGNILLSTDNVHDFNVYISDMGLCKKIDDINETNIYGVMPYVAPEVLRGNPYTQAADIYGFGMIMYVIATGRQPF